MPCYSLCKGVLLLFNLISSFSLVRKKIHLTRHSMLPSWVWKEKTQDKTHVTPMCLLLILYAESIICGCEYKTSHHIPKHLKSRVAFFEHGSIIYSVAINYSILIILVTCFTRVYRLNLHGQTSIRYNSSTLHDIFSTPPITVTQLNNVMKILHAAGTTSTLYNITTNSSQFF